MAQRDPYKLQEQRLPGCDCWSCSVRRFGQKRRRQSMIKAYHNALAPINRSRARRELAKY
jgi:hypothetical protein